MRNWRTAVLAAAMVAAGAATASAQESELVTDRPDFTESSEVVGRGVFQFESGFSYERADGCDRAEHHRARLAAPRRPRPPRRAAARHRRLPVRSPRRRRALRHSRHGSRRQDPAAGIRTPRASTSRSFRWRRCRPAATGVTSGGVDPTLKMTWARDLPAGFGLTGNFNVSSLSSERRPLRAAGDQRVARPRPVRRLGRLRRGLRLHPDGSRRRHRRDGRRRHHAAHRREPAVRRRSRPRATPARRDWSVGFGFAIREPSVAPLTAQG